MFQRQHSLCVTGGQYRPFRDAVIFHINQDPFLEHLVMEAKYLGIKYL